MAEKKWYERWVGKVGVSVNPEPRVVAEIEAGLEANKKKLGVRHCPCLPAYTYNKDTVCPCKATRDEIAAGTFTECHCGLFVKKIGPK